MMLEKMILINSANFKFADIDFSKEVFFVGDNAGGKTTTTRAIHFLYNGDGDKLGIPRSKDSFAKHYFPHDDSYIIYVFETFFIFVYKRNGAIKKWFSKQKFAIEQIIRNEKLLNFKSIVEYIKSAELSIKPDSIHSYTDILYGKNSKYLDFAIDKIENYSTFLSVYNSIFNVDKSIVSAIDVKKAIQKSLNRRDEVLSIDYNEFIRKLNDFLGVYHFFKIFDNNKVNLKEAINLKNSLLGAEEKINLLLKAITYKHKIETEKLKVLEIDKQKHKESIEKHKNKIKKIGIFYASFQKRVKNKLEAINREIMGLEHLKEKFASFEVERNISLASKYESILNEFDRKKHEYQTIQDNISDTRKVIEKQIEQLEYTIKVTIPNEMKKKFFDLSEVEKYNYEEEVLLISNEYVELEKEIESQIISIKEKARKDSVALELLEENINKEIKKLRSNAVNKIDVCRVEIKSLHRAFDENEKTLRELISSRDKKDNELRRHKEKYSELRRINAKNLSSSRNALNLKIANAKAILYPVLNSFNEFLSNEIEDWEKEIYPIIDKKLLLKSCDELKPQKLESEFALGFKVDTNNLEKIPTKDEALKIIKNAKNSKFETLKNSKSVYKGEIAKLDEKKNKIVADLESMTKQIESLKDLANKLSLDISNKRQEINDIDSNLSKDIHDIRESNKTTKEYLEEKIKNSNIKIAKKKNEEIVDLHRKKVNRTRVKAKNRDENIEKIKIEIEKENKIAKLEKLSEIKSLKESSQDQKQDKFINELSEKIKTLKKQHDEAYDAVKYLKDYEKQKDNLLLLPIKEKRKNDLESASKQRELLIEKINKKTNTYTDTLHKKIQLIVETMDKYEKGIKRYKSLGLEYSSEEVETVEMLINLLDQYEEIKRDYSNNKSKFRAVIDKLKKLERHSLIEINLNNENFDEVESIKDLSNILESLDELEKFENTKYDSERKRRHNDFDTFLKNTIPSKLQSFDDLEIDFEKAKNSINKNLANADFGVIKNIRLETGGSKKKNTNIASLLQQLSSKIKETVSFYAKASLFYYDAPKSIDYIQDIQSILEQIKEKGPQGSVNLFDTIDLSISYVENGKHVENKQSIRDDSSSGGNILLKVAIAMALLKRYIKSAKQNSAFFLIIDEISKLQRRNQEIIKDYINSNGFKTLFITPDPVYPDPDKALYYTFKNILEDGESLEIRQMNII